MKLTLIQQIISQKGTPKDLGRKGIKIPLEGTQKPTVVDGGMFETKGGKVYFTVTRDFPDSVLGFGVSHNNTKYTIDRGWVVLKDGDVILFQKDETIPPVTFRYTYLVSE